MFNMMPLVSSDLPHPVYNIYIIYRVGQKVKRRAPLVYTVYILYRVVQMSLATHV
jgi:hypothetical protein